MVADGQLTISTEFSHTFTVGYQTSFQQTYKASFPVKAPPHTTVHAVSTVTKGTLEVPYTLLVIITFPLDPPFKFGYTMDGIWHGVSTWDLHHKITKE